MKASKFTDAQKAFVIKQGEEGTPIRRSPRPVTNAFAISIYHTARPPHAHPVMIPEMSNRFPMCDGRHHFL